jgi:hypothetical protein
MTARGIFKPLFCALLLAALTFHGSPARAAESGDSLYDGKVHVTLVPYLWLPTLNAKFRYNLSDIHDRPIDADSSRTFDTQVGPNKYLTHLNFAIMAAGEIRKGPFALYTDVINTNLGNSGSKIVDLSGRHDNLDFPVTADASSHEAATIWTLAPSGTLYHKDRTNVQLLFGVRMIWLTASADWQLSGPYGLINPNGSVSKKENGTDTIFGTYGQVGIGKHWSIPFYFDAGTGTPSGTFQGVLGVKYGQASLTWRELDFQGSGDALVQNLRLSGPQFGYSFVF